MLHTIIVADDLAATRDTLERILQKDYNIIKAANGADAVAKMSMAPFPYVALLGVHLSGISSFDVFRQMKDHIILKDVPVIFLSEGEDDANEERALDMGAADVITKPFKPGTLSRKIRNLIELKLFRENSAAVASALTRQLESHSEELHASHSAIIMGMSLLSESRDQTTGSHLIRVSSLTKILTDTFASLHPDKLSFRDAALITTYAPLHDIGKVGVPDAVLNKQGKLTDEEFEQMKSHTTAGGDLLRQVASLLLHEQERINIAIEIAEFHHEKYDGSGYPKGLVGDAIPISARITAVADVYDALRSSRSYKKGFTHEEAVSLITKGDGRIDPKHFDPQILEIFSMVHEALREVYDNNPDPNV